MQSHQELVDDTFRAAHLSRFWGALIGATVGYALALIVTCLAFPPPKANYHASGTLKWVSSLTSQETREVGFYLLFMLAGGVGSLLGSTRCLQQPSKIRLLVLLVTVPIAALTAQAVMPQDRLATLPILIPFCVWTVVLAMTLRGGRELQSKSVSPVIADLRSDARPHRFENVLTVLIPLVIFMAILCPISPELVAGWMNRPKSNCHIATYLIGPATYSYASDLIPGIDYFTQYGVGFPYLCSWILTDRVDHTLMHAVWFLTIVHIFFFTSLSVFLTWFFDSRWWALVVSVALAIIQFHTDEPMWNPSHYPIRYLLMMIAAMSFLRWTHSRFSRATAIELALVLAASLFLNTETGVYFIVASTLGAFVMCPDWKHALVRVGGLNVLVLVWFLSLSVLAFGWRVLDPDYLYFLFEPLWIYGSGMGGLPLAWNSGFHYLANIICPIVAVASLGWIAVAIRSPMLSELDCRKLAATVFFALSGLFMMAKYVNRSNLSVWISNLAPMCVVVGWWARAVSCSWGEKSRFRAIPLRAVGNWVLIGSVCLFVGLFHDGNNPMLYSYRSYRRYPTVVNRVLDVFDKTRSDMRAGDFALVSAEDVALIQKHTRPGERVAIFHPCDWWYLVSSRRASHFQFLPSTMMFTERQASESGIGLNKLFVPARPLGKEFKDLMGIEVDETFYSHFTWEETGKDLAIWRRTSE